MVGHYIRLFGLSLLADIKTSGTRKSDGQSKEIKKIMKEHFNLKFIAYREHRIAGSMNDVHVYIALSFFQ